MKSTLLAQAAFAAFTSAHFNLNYPAARGFDEDKLVQFPCGSFNTPSSNRTLWPLSGGSIALEMGHVDANVEVLIGVGNDVGDAFNTVLRQTFQETGLGAFCMTGFTIPSSLNVTEGMNATIQVVTNGDPDGGLYNCADITFSSSAPSPNDCKNGTGVTAATTTIKGNPNETTTDASSTSSGAASKTSAGAAATSSKPGAASSLQVSVAGFIVAAGAAFAMAL